MDTTAKDHWNQTYRVRPMVEATDVAKSVLQYVQPPAHILDIGCGDGRDALFFAQHGFSVTATDFSETAIEKLRSHASSVDAHVMDTTSLHFPDASFDAVFAHLSLHYFDDATTARVFENIYRMLKPGGYFFARCKSTKDPDYGKGEHVGERMYVHGHLRHYFTPEYLRKNLEHFTVISLRETSATYDGKTSHFVESVARRD